MRILVTGGAGFIGSRLVQRLRREHPDYRITVLDALTYAGTVDNLPTIDGKQLHFVHGDIRNEELVDTLVSENDVVVHLAAETHIPRSIQSADLFVQTDMMGTLHLCQAAVKHSIKRFVHISSSEVYGSSQTPFMDESHPVAPQSPYAAAKAGADRLVYSFWATYGLPAVIVRPFNNYGPVQHVEKAIPRFITHCLLGEPIVIHGSGAQERDWIYVEDHCEALDKIIHCPLQLEGEVLNIASGQAASIMDIAQLIRECTGADVDIQNGHERPGMVWRHQADPRKAENLLQWKATTSLEDGIKQTIDWLKAHPDYWQKQLEHRFVSLVGASGAEEQH